MTAIQVSHSDLCKASNRPLYQLYLVSSLLQLNVSLKSTPLLEEVSFIILFQPRTTVVVKE